MLIFGYLLKNIAALTFSFAAKPFYFSDSIARRLQIEDCIEDEIDDHKTYQLSLQYDLSSVRAKYGQGLVLDEGTGYPYFDLFDFWWDDQNYSEGDRVEVLNLISLSGEVISTGISVRQLRIH